MKRIIECVMNVSEGRDETKLKAIAEQIANISDTFLLDYSADPAHHRTVFTYIGTPNSIFEATFKVVKKAMQLIDLQEHKGVHPRIGAVDVIPFVPIRGVNMKDCVRIAHGLGRRIASDLEVPVYFYAEAAAHIGRRNLFPIRKGEFEGLSQRVISDSNRQPDFGSNRLHYSAGAIAIGARNALIAYNIFLNTSDVEVAQKIAIHIRESSGGLVGVKALGFYIDYKDLAQVSMNVTNYQHTPLSKIFKSVQRKARHLGVDVVSSEIVGLVPQAALKVSSADSLKLEGFDSGQILETRIDQVLNNTRGPHGGRGRKTKMQAAYLAG